MATKVEKEEIEKIEWRDLDKFMCKPVWDKKHSTWRVIDGYKRYDDNYNISFTDVDSFVNFNNVELYTCEV